MQLGFITPQSAPVVAGSVEDTVFAIAAEFHQIDPQALCYLRRRLWPLRTSAT